MQETEQKPKNECYEYLVTLLEKYCRTVVGYPPELMKQYVNAVLSFEGRENFNVNIGDVGLNGINLSSKNTAILRVNGKQLTVVELLRLEQYFQITKKESLPKTE
jgi:hypothetical protein